MVANAEYFDGGFDVGCFVMKEGKGKQRGKKIAKGFDYQQFLKSLLFSLLPCERFSIDRRAAENTEQR